MFHLERSKLCAINSSVLLEKNPKSGLAYNENETQTTTTTTTDIMLT